jgi:hypothetical protein
MRKFDPLSLGGTGFLRMTRFGDGAQLLHQTKQVNLGPVLLHLAPNHAVDLDAGVVSRSRELPHHVLNSPGRGAPLYVRRLNIV